MKPAAAEILWIEKAVWNGQFQQEKLNKLELLNPLERKVLQRGKKINCSLRAPVGV